MSSGTAHRSALKQALGRVVAGLYVAVAVGLAVTGASKQMPQPYLLDVAWTLPFGVPAFISVYVGYGLLVGVGGALHIPTETASGLEPLWLTLGSDTLDTIIFGLAAVFNVLALRRRVRARRVRQAMRDSASPGS